MGRKTGDNEITVKKMNFTRLYEQQHVKYIP